MTTYETEIIIFDDCNEYMRLVGLFWCFAGVAQR